MKLPKAPKILLSRGDMCGDVVVTTALIAPIKKAFPESKLYYLVQKPFIPLLDDHPDIEACIEDPIPYTMTSAHKADFKTLSKTLKAYQFDIFLGLWEHPRYGQLAKKAGIPIRIGHRSSLSNIYTYTHTVPLDSLDYTQHKVEMNAALLKPLGIHDTSQYGVDLHVQTSELNDFQQRHPWSLDRFVMIHLDAGTPQRVLMTQHLIHIVAYLRQKNVSRIILFGRDRNAEAAADIIAHNDNDPRIECHLSLSLKDLKIALSQCAFLIGSDSGPAHIASAFKKPVIMHYFNRIQNALHWGPWQTPHTIIKSEHTCEDVCHPNICRKPDCRETISIAQFKAAIDTYYDHLEYEPIDQRQYWRGISLTITIFGPENRRFLIH